MNWKFLHLLPCLIGLLASPVLYAEDKSATEFQPVTCEGTYKQHLQGVCTNVRDAIYWSWTDVLVKTDAKGHVLQKVQVASHHGDLCYHEGRVYVAVNLGKFNEAPGKADSWVYVYDAETLAEVARHPVPEVVHGAGGMAFREGRFYIVGGLPGTLRRTMFMNTTPASSSRSAT